MRISDWSSDVCSSDLLDVAAALEAAGIEVLLVRDSNRRPKLVADAATGPTALRSLQSARPGEPFYLQRRGADEVPIHGPDIAAGTIASSTGFRPLPGTTSASPYAPSPAPRLEFWRFGPQLAEAHRATAAPH